MQSPLSNHLSAPFRLVALFCLSWVLSLSAYSEDVNNKEIPPFPSDEEILANGWRKLTPEQAEEIIKRAQETEKNAPLIRKSNFDSTLDEGFAVDTKRVTYEKREPDGFLLTRTETTRETTSVRSAKDEVSKIVEIRNREGIWKILDNRVFKVKYEEDFFNRINSGLPSLLPNKDTSDVSDRNSRFSYSGVECEGYDIVRTGMIILNKENKKVFYEFDSVDRIDKSSGLEFQNWFQVNSFSPTEDEGVKKVAITNCNLKYDCVELLDEVPKDLFSIPPKAKIKVWNSDEEEERDRLKYSTKKIKA